MLFILKGVPFLKTCYETQFMPRSIP